MSTARFSAAMLFGVAFVTPLAAASTSARGEEMLAKTLAGTTAGKPQTCYSTFPQTDSRNVEGIGMLYRSGRTWWLNRFAGGCPQLDSSTAIVTSTPSTQLCRGDIARIVDTNVGMDVGSCVLSDFVPYTKAK